MTLTIDTSLTVNGAGGSSTIASTNSLLIGDGAGNAIAAGAGNITSASANALTVGLNGATSPALQVDASTALSVTGVAIKSGTTATTLTAISSGSNCDISLIAKGFATAGISGQFVNIQGSTGSVSQFGLWAWAYSFRNGTNTAYTFTGNTDSGLTASVDNPSMDMNFAQTKTHDAGTLATQTDIRLRPSTHAFATASTLTAAYGVKIDGAPIASTNATVTESTTLYLGANAVGAATVTSYGLVVNPNTGGTTNYGIKAFGKTGFDATNTAGGTTGNRTIDKPSGTVNIAAAGSTVTVTNALCTTASIVFATVRTNDTTALIKNVVPGSGSFVITMNANVTAETSIGFFIIN